MKPNCKERGKNMISYRHYQSGDEQQIVELWNESVQFDPITEKRFRNLVLLDANFDPVGLKLAFEGDKLIGCVYGVRRLLPMYGTDLELENGWIVFFFVHPTYRNRGIGTKLMNNSMAFFKEANRKHIFFASYAPNYLLPGIDEQTYPDAYHFLLKQNFKKQYSPIAMDRNLIGFNIPKKVMALQNQREAEGYTFTIAKNKDLYEMISFANEIFNPDWGRAIREGILQGLPLERIFFAREKDRLVGFCLYGGYEGVPERFGPFGVDPNQQGKGLGKILLYNCLRSMRAEGLHNAWFLWTGEKTAAGYLYKNTGFEISRTFHVMKKSI